MEFTFDHVAAAFGLGVILTWTVWDLYTYLTK